MAAFNYGLQITIWWILSVGLYLVGRQIQCSGDSRWKTVISWKKSVIRRQLKSCVFYRNIFAEAGPQRWIIDANIWSWLFHTPEGHRLDDASQIKKMLLVIVYFWAYEIFETIEYICRLILCRVYNSNCIFHLTTKWTYEWLLIKIFCFNFEKKKGTDLCRKCLMGAGSCSETASSNLASCPKYYDRHYLPWKSAEQFLRSGVTGLIIHNSVR